MKTVGMILRNTRKEKGLTIEVVEQDTKIRAKFLTAIEADDFHSLPTLTYAKGFVKNYSEYLGLDSKTVLAFFRRQSQELPKSSLLPKGVAEPLNTSALRLTPGRFLALVLVSLGTIFLGYLGFQYRTLTQPPDLIIETPIDKEIVTEGRINVLGKTDPDATVAINGVTVLVRSDGRFFDTVLLERGVNIITLVATSRYGKSKTEEIEVGYQSAE
jgi:transcriptional regulator with XRE-family HTH domain